MTIKEYVKKTRIYPLASFLNKTARAVLGMPKKISNIIFPKTIVLLYHRVCDLKNDPESLAVSPEFFEAHMKYLKDNFTMLSLEEFHESWKSKKNVKNGVLITFDDGYLDNFSHAYPILKKYQIPAVFFVAGDGRGNKEFWWDELSRIIQDPSEYKIMHAKIKSLPYEKREEIINGLFAQKNIARNIRPEFERMGSQECEIMSESGLISIGGHTMHHCQLSCLSAEEQEKEIQDNFAFIKNVEKKSPLAFAYPFGTRDDYNDETMGIVKKYYECAFVNFKDQVRKNTDIYQIPRFVIKNWPMEEFQKKIKSFFII